MLKKCLSLLSELSEYRLFLTRYLVNFVGFIEIVSLPLLLAPGFYTEVELMRQLFLMTPLFILGVHSGYLFVLYRGKQDLQFSLVAVAMLIGALVGGTVGVLTDAVLPAMAVFLMILVTAIEKVLIAQARLIVASVYKAMISVAILSAGAYMHLAGIESSALTVYSGCVVLGLLFWGGIVYSHADFGRLNGQLEWRRCWEEFLVLARHGFLISVQSYLLIGYFLIDRYTVNSFYPENASEYALGFSLAQIVFIGVNTIAFAAQQKIGERFDHFTRRDYSRMLTRTALIFAALFGLGVVAASLFSLVVDGYGSFIVSFAIIALLFGVYYVFSAFAVIGFYQKKSAQGFFVMLAFLALNAFSTWIVVTVEGGYYLNLIKSGLLLVVSALVFDRMIYRELQQA